MAASAVGANTFYEEIDALHLEAFGHRQMRDVKAMETEGTLAQTTIEMDMLVVERTIVVTLTSFIAGNPCSVFDSMNKMLSQQQRKCAEDGGPVYSIEAVVQLAQRQRMTALGQSAIDQQTRGSGLDTTLLQMLSIIFCLHRVVVSR